MSIVERSPGSLQVIRCLLGGRVLFRTTGEAPVGGPGPRGKANDPRGSLGPA